MTEYKPGSPHNLNYRDPGLTQAWQKLVAAPRRLWPKKPLDDPRDRAVLSLDRVVLTPPQPQDYRAWADTRRSSRDFLAPWEPAWPNDALSWAGYTKRITQQCEDWNADRAYHFLIWRQADPVLVGGMALTHIRRGVAQAGTLGYWLAADHTGQGLMTEALLGVIDFAFATLGLNRLEAATMLTNQPSQRLLARAGFRQEGQAPDYLKIAGQWQDHWLYGLTRRQWSDQPGDAQQAEPDFI
ncbi:MAG: GNAT family protein [Pseudomonadota bacterium]